MPSLNILFECTAVMLYHKIIIHVDHLPDRAFNNSTPPSHVFTAESLLLKASAAQVTYSSGGCGGGKRVDIDSWAKEKQRVANNVFNLVRETETAFLRLGHGTPSQCYGTWTTVRSISARFGPISGRFSYYYLRMKLTRIASSSSCTVSQRFGFDFFFWSV